MKSIKERIVTGIIWNILLTGSMQGSTFINNLILAKSLGKIDFGKFAILLATMQMGAQVFNGAIGVTATKFIGNFNQQSNRHVVNLLSKLFFKKAILLSLSAVITILILNVYEKNLNDLFYTTRQKAISYLAISIYLISSIFVSCEIGILQGLEKLKVISIVSVITMPISIVLALLLSKSYHLPGAILAVTFPIAILGLLGYYYANKQVGIERTEVDKPQAIETKRIIRDFSVPAALSGLTYIPALWIMYPLIAKSKGDGIIACGCYTLAMNLRSLCIIAPSLFNNIFLTILSNHHTDTIEKQKEIYKNNIVLSTAMTTIVAFLICLIVYPFLKYYKYNYNKYTLYVILIVISSIFEIYWISKYQIMRHKELMWRALFLVSIPRDLFLTVSAFILIPRYSILGAAFALFFGHFFTALNVRFISNQIISKMEKSK